MIAKLVSHPSIDLLFRRALPELRFVDLGGGQPRDPRYGELRAERFVPAEHNLESLMGTVHLGWMLREHLGLWRPDLMIVDHELGLFVAEQVEARRIVWYCHADYTLPPPRRRRFDLHWLERLGAAPAIYPSEAKRERSGGMRKARGPELVIPLAVPDEAFVSIPKERNGRVACVRHSIPSRLRLNRPGFFRALFRGVCRLVPDLDIYGSGNTPDDRMFGSATLKPSVRIRDLADYAVAVEPFGNHSPSACQLELMAAGVPLVTYPREGFEQEGSFLLAATPEEFLNQCERARREPHIGTLGQIYVRQRHSEAAWCQAVVEWLASL